MVQFIIPPPSKASASSVTPCISEKVRSPLRGGGRVRGATVVPEDYEHSSCCSTSPPWDGITHTSMGENPLSTDSFPCFVSAARQDIL